MITGHSWRIRNKVDLSSVCITAILEYAIPNDLFIISDITDKRVEANVMDPILNNLFDKTKAAFIRFHKNKLVNNPILYANFEKYREKLKQNGTNPNEVYGFIQLPNGDHGEVRDTRLFKTGDLF